LLEACGWITAEMAEEWFHHAGYIHFEIVHMLSSKVTIFMAGSFF